MTDKLPPQLLQLFAPRPPLRWVEPTDHPPEKRFTRAITGVVECLGELQKYKETDQYTPTESWLEARDRKSEEKKAAIKKLLQGGPDEFNPSEDPNIRGNALSTMVVSRLSYDADERDLERHFGRFGSIERIRVICDTRAHEKPNKKKKPHRGYAFIVFERESDMQAAVRTCDGDRIRGRAIKTDVERGRTVHGWKPRRLGGGLGGRGYTKLMPSRPVGPRGFGDGFRGGYRGFDGGRPRGGGRGGRGGFRGDFGGPRDRNSFGPPVAHLPAQDLIDATATAAFRDPASIREDLDALTTGLAANVKVAGLATATADDGPAVTWNRLGVVTVVGIATGEETATATETATVIGIGEAGIVATMIGRERMTTGSEPTKEEGTTIPGKCLVTNPCANTYWTAAPIPAW
ncbi:hypothetical protein G6O67_003957 [Ophiocordyceps sinensis]|uniref:U1 small nuclear ribonucleoprotein 70 kDa n=1 Tax=Ophiocordyceps sinensis TaxID=72228 RepID=A0A8H4LXL9_9HYPO|nr:hypothetical protein G6O67_003957 [Ophiocordyceps sinensis]